MSQRPLIPYCCVASEAGLERRRASGRAVKPEGRQPGLRTQRRGESRGAPPAAPPAPGKLCRGGRTYPGRSRGSAAGAGPWPRGRSASDAGAGEAPRPWRCERGGPGAGAAPPGSGPALPAAARGTGGEALPRGHLDGAPALLISPSKPEPRKRELTVPKESTEQSCFFTPFP